MRYLLIFIALSLFLSGCRVLDQDPLDETIYLDHKDGSMPAYVRGNNNSKNFILLLHGGPGGNGLQYSVGSAADILEEDLVMVYWDQRGQGMSQGTYPSDVLNISLLVQDVKAMIQVLKKRYGNDINVYLLGHSWGGMLGTSFLLTQDNQSLVKGWIEVDGAHDQVMIFPAAMKRMRELADIELNSSSDKEFWNETLDLIEGMDSTKLSRSDKVDLNKQAFDAEKVLRDDNKLGGDSQFDLSYFYGPTNLTNNFISGRLTNNFLEDENLSTSHTNNLDKITIPCLFLWGDYDLVVPKRLGITAFNKVSSTEKKLVIFPRSGHSPMQNEPDKYAFEILHFVRRTQ